jgi:hypothetical protein
MRIALKTGRLLIGLGPCVISLLMFASCYSLGERKAGIENLVPSIEQFDDAIRWEDYKTAGLYLEAPFQKGFWDLADNLQRKVKITGYEVRKVDHPDKSPSADVLLCFRVYYTNDPCIRTVNLRQHWSFDEKDKHWVVVNHDLEALLPSRTD